MYSLLCVINKVRVETQLILIEIGTRPLSHSKLELFLICVRGTIMYKFISQPINYLIGNILYKHLLDYCSLSKLYNMRYIMRFSDNLIEHIYMYIVYIDFKILQWCTL